MRRTSSTSHSLLVRVAVFLPMMLLMVLLAQWLTAPTYASQLAQQIAATETPSTLKPSKLMFVASSLAIPGQAAQQIVASPSNLSDQFAAPLAGQIASLNAMPSTTITANEPIPNNCEVNGMTAAPHGPWVVIELECNHGHVSAIRLVNSANGLIQLLAVDLGSNVIFLGWSPNGQHVIVLKDVLSEARPVLVSVTDGSLLPLKTPLNVYNVAVSLDGTKMIYSLTRGLGFGSETWLADIDGQNPRLLIQDPTHIIVYARFSPNGQKIAYIRMMDSNIPFTVGELWVMNADGSAPTQLGPADAGHGYAPMWSPDSSQVAYVYRENQGNLAADQIANQLTSNIQLAHIETTTVKRVTNFENTLVESPVWSPDGSQLAFAALPSGGISDIWVYASTASNEKLLSVTENANTRYPVFTSDR